MKFYFILGLLATSGAIEMNKRKIDGELPPQYDAKQMGDPWIEKVARTYGEKDKNKIYISEGNVKTLAFEIMTENQGLRPFDARNHIAD